MGPALPQVASIAPTAADAGGTPDINSILATIQGPQAQQPNVPATIQGHESTPKFNAPAQHAPQQMESRTTGTAMEKKAASRHNALAQMSNLFNEYNQKKQADKSENLKTEISTIMKAQNQIDNANAVLANDPNNANAKQVIEQNKKVIESKFEDKKIAGQLKKAFDVSFVDPEKNNTPEVKAMQAATKEVKAATAAGIDHNTPQEKAIAQQAASGGKPPVQVAQGAATAPATSQTARSATPYADQFLKSQPATIQANPEFTKQQQQIAANNAARDKQINQYVIPKLIDTYSKYQVQQLKDGNSAARTEFTQAQETHRKMLELTKDLQVADARDKTEIQKQGMADATRMAQTTLRVNAALGAADAKGVKGTPLEAKVQQQGLKMLDDAISSTTKNNTELSAQQAANRNKKGNVVDEDKEAAIRHQMDMNGLAIRQYNDQRAKAMTKIYGKPQAGAGDESVTGNTQGYINVNGSNATGDTKRVVQSVGKDESDTDDEDGAIDDIVKAFPIEKQ